MLFTDVTDMQVCAHRLKECLTILQMSKNPRLFSQKRSWDKHFSLASWKMKVLYTRSICYPVTLETKKGIILYMIHKLYAHHERYI